MESTVIKYHLRSAGNVAIHVYNQEGRLIETLTNEPKTAGDYEVTWNAAAHPSGMYLVSITLGNSGTRTLKINKSN
jgi:flagellar hook assembly protein FlgD